jgi:secondary thiamine-phosphate synthase enzyme
MLARLIARSAVAVTRASTAAARAPPAAVPRRGFKSYTKELTIKTEKRMSFQNITALIEAEVASSGVKEGFVLVNSMHTSSSVFIDDDDAGLYVDLEAFANRTAAWDPIEQYRHNVNGEVNGAAHLQRAVFGREAVIAITAGKLHLGKWERVLYGEFDGMRAKKVLVKVLGQ